MTEFSQLSLNMAIAALSAADEVYVKERALLQKIMDP